MPPTQQPKQQQAETKTPAQPAPSLPAQQPKAPPVIHPAPYIPEEPKAPAYAKHPDAGMLTITAENALQFKLCWGKCGDLPRFMNHLRDKFITDAWGIFRAAREHGFGDALLLTRDGRIDADGDGSEPPTGKEDDARKLFHDDKANPLGAYGKNVTHMSMKDEFEIVAKRKAAADVAKRRPV